MQRDQLFHDVDSRMSAGVAGNFNAEYVKPWDEERSPPRLCDCLLEFLGMRPPELTRPVDDDRRNPEIEAFLRKLEVDIHESGPDAAYSPNNDVLRIPRFKAFDDPRIYYAIVLHELGHWSGHRSRTNRLNQSEDGLASLTRRELVEEEMIAEMTAAYLTQHFGIHIPERHLSYLHEWRAHRYPEMLESAKVKAKEAFEYLLRKAGLEA